MSEFRVFLPLTHARSAGQLAPEWHVYESAVNAAFDALGRSQLGAADRVDAYLVAPPHWGCKYRHGKKLEVKYRVGTAACAAVADGIELFSKVSYGKEEVPQQAAAIVAKLKRHNIFQVTDEALLSRPVFIDLAKARVCERLHSAYLEVAHVTAPGLDSGWMSVAIEGEAKDIEIALERSKTERRFVLLWHACALAVQLSRSLPLTHAPVVFGGYPSLVHILGGRASEDERARQLNSMLQFASTMGARTCSSCSSRRFNGIVIHNL